MTETWPIDGGELGALIRAFDWLTNKKMGTVTLHAKKECADQLRALNGITREIVSATLQGEIYTVHVRATVPGTKGGRPKSIEDDIGAVSIKDLTGEHLANAMKRAVTQGKRRATLAAVGLGIPDESDAAPEAEPERPAPRLTAVPQHEEQVLTPAGVGAVSAAAIKAWAEPPAAVPPPSPPGPRATEAQCEEMKRLVRALGLHTQEWQAVLAKRGVTTGRDLTPGQAQEVIDKMRQKVQRQATQPANGQLQPIAAGGALLTRRSTSASGRPRCGP